MPKDIVQSKKKYLRTDKRGPDIGCFRWAHYNLKNNKQTRNQNHSTVVTCLALFSLTQARQSSKRYRFRVISKIFLKSFLH